MKCIEHVRRDLCLCTGFSKSSCGGLEEIFPSRIFGSKVMILCLMSVLLNQVLTHDNYTLDTHTHSHTQSIAHSHQHTDPLTGDVPQTRWESRRWKTRWLCCFGWCCSWRPRRRPVSPRRLWSPPGSPLRSWLYAPQRIRSRRAGSHPGLRLTTKMTFYSTVNEIEQKETTQRCLI